DEYLSLGQVPRIGSEPATADGIVSTDETMSAFLTPGEDGSEESAAEEASAKTEDEPADSDDEAIVAGTLRSPWKWEELIVEWAVVGGGSGWEGHARWRRRLDGLAADYRFRIAELARDEPESARISRFERDLRNLMHLRAFALPVVGELSSWPERAKWGDWL